MKGETGEKSGTSGKGRVILINSIYEMRYTIYKKGVLL